MPYYKLLAKAKRNDTSLAVLGLIELAVHQLWYVKRLFPRQDFRKTMWRGVVTWMCRKREAKKELENFLEYVGGVVEKNKDSPIYLVFTVEKYEAILEEYIFQVNGREPKCLREEELLESLRTILLMTRPETDEGRDEELDYDLEMKIPPPLILPCIKPDPDWCIGVSRHSIRVTDIVGRMKLRVRTNKVEESGDESDDESEDESILNSEKELVEESESEWVDGSEYESENESAEEPENEVAERQEKELIDISGNESAEESENESAEESENESAEESENESILESENESIFESENESENEVEELANELREEPLRETLEPSSKFRKIEVAQELSDAEEGSKEEFVPRRKRVGKLASKKVEDLKKGRLVAYRKEKKSFREKEAGASGVKIKKLWPYDLIKEIRRINREKKALKAKNSEKLMCAPKLNLFKTDRSKLENIEKSVEKTKYPTAQEIPMEPPRFYSYNFTNTGGMWPTRNEEPKAEVTDYLKAEQVEAALKALRTDAFVHCGDRKKNQTMVKKVHFEKGENSVKSQVTGKVVKGKPDIQIKMIDMMIKALIVSKAEAKKAQKLSLEIARKQAGAKSMERETSFLTKKIDWSKIFNKHPKNSEEMLNPENLNKLAKSKEGAEELLVAKKIEEKSLQVGKTDAVDVNAGATGSSPNNEKHGRRPKKAKRSRARKSNKEFSRLEITFGQINLADFLNV